ncbi:glycerophosphodiester phosphodiesterase [Natrialbaceae archaeon A-gly3]
MAPQVIAHRGFAGVAPENTVDAAVGAAEYGETAMVEIDVQPAACGTPVVFHDDRLEGRRDGRPVTDAEGIVWETPLEVITDAEVLGSGQTVPTLAELLEAIPGTVGVNLELKNPGTADVRFGKALPADERDARRELWTPFLERVVADCDVFDGEILFSSFFEGAIAALREVAPEYAAAPLVWEGLAESLEVARRYDCEAIHPPLNAVAGASMAGNAYHGVPAGEPEVDVLEVAHEEGRTVNVWTVETWVQFDELRETGVDGIIADYPGLGSVSR